MNVSETIKNIRSSCDNYVDPDLVATVIHDNYYMGSNNIEELDKFDIKTDDSFEEKILKILKHENVFLNLGMYAFIPVINECDIYSTEDYNLKLSEDEFEKYANEKERVFGILIKKDSTDYVIGSCDLCGCSIDAAFKEIEPSELDFYKKIEEIIDTKIIY
ncbi:MAG: hypothetical protein U0L42_06955 [Methanobrevibacter sp.]|uniref:hypothetical protein n=1 Tax=Methanobrevibacter sp. TaxID=66852 RepID=UPI002E7936CD|nr:hypothetical protein [Methanobrevibacter sp.]MEE0935394.1 hypothetical protein [Methanobrevibacter sp.]